MTEVYFSFDTEDFTCDASSDVIRDQANLLREMGVRGNFNLVGYVAAALMRNGRQDVLEALRHHTVSDHSLRHSYHPTINEYTDKEDFDAAYLAFMKEECEALGMIRAVTGAKDLPAACPPGNSVSYVAMYGYADLGIPLYLGSLFRTEAGDGVYFCNGFHTNYDYPLEELFFNTPDYDVRAFLNRIASMKRVVLYNHPNKVLHDTFWDEVNFKKANLYPDGEWIEPPRRTAEAVARFYERERELIAALQADPRFTICDMETLREKTAKAAENRVVYREQLPAIASALKENFRWVEAPVSLSVCDCFYAAAHFLTSGEPYRPGKVHGFLETPEGARTEMTLSAGEVRSLAAQCRADKFIPAFFGTEKGIIGPADLLFAMLDIAQGAECAVIRPKPQQCDYSRYPNLASNALKGTWMHSDDFEDRYISDRLRLQAWTIRPEQYSL